MVTKEENAKMTCMKCNTLLTCRTKEYKGDYAPKLQWQNEDGTAHYKTTDGKDFTCVIPNEANTSDNRVETNIDPESLDKQGKEIFESLLLLDKIDKMTIDYLGKDAQVQKIGLWTKLVFQGMRRKKE